MKNVFDFEAKTPKKVEAIKFEGGQENGEEIVRWFASKGLTASYRYQFESSVVDLTDEVTLEVTEFISLHGPDEMYNVQVDEWVVFSEAGECYVLNDTEMRESYNQLTMSPEEA